MRHVIIRHFWPIGFCFTIARASPFAIPWIPILGLGYEMAKQLSELGAKEVVMLCRSEERGQKALEEIRKQTGFGIFFFEFLKFF